MSQEAVNALRQTVNLNDWLNTFARYSLFGEFESTDEFDEIIDDILEEIQELTPDEFERMRLQPWASDEAIDALEDLYENLLIDEFDLELRLVSPKYVNRYWVFTKSEFEVIQVRVYEIADGIDIAIVEGAYGSIEHVEDYLPANFENYDLAVYYQYGIEDDYILTEEQMKMLWAAMRDEDQKHKYLPDKKDRPNNKQVHEQCQKIIERFPGTEYAKECEKINGKYRSIMAHMITWPIAVFIIIFIIILMRSYRRRRQSTRTVSNEAPDTKVPPAATDLPPNYNFIMQFPPEYAEVIKNAHIEKSEDGPKN